jgi:hypothetical protein
MQGKNLCITHFQNNPPAAPRPALPPDPPMPSRFTASRILHARWVQGKNQLITHFQNSSLLHEDKRCRPILFKSDGEYAGEQEPFPSSTATRSHRARPFSGPDAA